MYLITICNGSRYIGMDIEVCEDQQPFQFHMYRL